MSAPPDERKERVIHARVPESLDDEIRRRASTLGLSVSNLVRNVLQNTFGLVEGIVADSAEVARAARGGAPRAAPPVLPGPAPRLLGWQSARLAVNAVCEVCNALLPKHGPAAIALMEGGGAARFRCTGCVEGGDAAEEASHDER